MHGDRDCLVIASAHLRHRTRLDSRAHFKNEIKARAYVNAEMAAVIQPSATHLSISLSICDLVVKLSGWRNKITKECEAGAFNGAPACIQRHRRRLLYAPFSTSRFDVSSETSVAPFQSRRPPRRRAFVVPWPDLRHAAHPRRTPSNRAIPFTRTCVWYARLRHGFAHVRLIRLDMRALSLYRARLPRQRWITRDAVYARCCALLSFRHGVLK